MKSLGSFGCISNSLTTVYVCYEGFEGKLEWGKRERGGKVRWEERRPEKEGKKREGGRKGRTKRTSA